MSMLISSMLNGLHYGLILFLLAAGLSLTFGLMGVINLAHGSYFMVGAYIGWAVGDATGSFLVGLAAAVGVTAVLGWLTERFLLRRLHGEHLQQVLLTIGIVYIVMDLIKTAWGGTARLMATPAILDSSVTFGSITYPLYRLALMGVGTVMAIFLWWFQEKTRLGAVVRAGVDDKQMVTAVGINIYLVFALVFTLGTALAGFAGVMGAPVLGVYLTLDSDVLVPAIAVVIIGGLGSLKGALAASILVGMVRTFTQAYSPGFTIMAIYAVVIVVLLIKPSGLFGAKGQ